MGLGLPIMKSVTDQQNIRPWRNNVNNDQEYRGRSLWETEHNKRDWHCFDILLSFQVLSNESKFTHIYRYIYTLLRRLFCVWKKNLFSESDHTMSWPFCLVCSFGGTYGAKNVHYLDQTSYLSLSRMFLRRNIHIYRSYRHRTIRTSKL